MQAIFASFFPPPPTLLPSTEQNPDLTPVCPKKKLFLEFGASTAQSPVTLTQRIRLLNDDL